jgi:SHS2 domain-containing protein
MGNEKRHKGNETFEHPADMGVRGWGETLEEAFEQTAKAMFGIMGRVEASSEIKPVKITSQGESLEELLVDFLNYLISSADIHSLYFTKVKVESIRKRGDRHDLEAIAWGIPLSSQAIDFYTEVKAASYCDVSVKKLGRDRWVAQCIVDL